MTLAKTAFENIVGKEENTGSQHNLLMIIFSILWLPAFSPHPTMFSKSFSLRVGKGRDCVRKFLRACIAKKIITLKPFFYAPISKDWGAYCFTIVCPSIRRSVWPSVCLSAQT